MSDGSTPEYSLPVCWLIALTPLAVALLITYLAPPRGFVIDFQPFSWIADYVVIWPVVWFSAEILTAAKGMWWSPETGLNLHMALRLTGGFTLIYVCVWLCAVPLIGQLYERFDFNFRNAPTYSQLLRFLTGIFGSVALRLFYDIHRAKQVIE